MPTALNVERRFWSYVNKTETCWLWTGAKKKSRPNAKYYGYFRVGRKVVLAHRYSYKLIVGSIPDELPLDHVAELCNSTLCVFPEHLEPVTSKENTRRYWAQFDTCPYGHEYTPENTYITPKGHRQCRECKKLRMRKARLRVVNG